MEGMDMSRLLAGGAIGGVLITLVTVFWRKIKASWHYVTGLLVQRMVIRLDARYSMMSYLARYGKVSRFRDIFVSAYSEVVKRGHYELTSFEPICLNGTNLIWLGNVPVMITIGGSDKGNISDNGNMPGVIHLSFLRGTIDPDKLVKKATEEYNLTSQNNWVLKANSRKRFFVKRIPEAAAGTSQSKGSTPDRNETSIQWYQFSFNRLISHNVDDLGNPVNCNGKALENLFFPAHIEKMQQEIVLWRSKREWYFQRGLPWKRGWLMYGPPGVGKTSLARAFAQDLDMPVFVFSLGELSNSEFRRKWMEMQTNVPCIALIEDIDGVFHGRKNISGGNAEMSAFLRNAEMMGRDGQDGQGGDGEDTISQPKEASGEDGEGRQQRQMRRPQIPMNSGLTFDCLLNVLDGVERLEGVFVIITTNDITKVDPAIGQPTGDNGSTRPGRIDRVIELRNMAKFDKCRMAKRILSDFPDDLEKLIDKVNNDPNEPEQSPCQFQERCSQIALQRLWDVEGEALKREV